MPYFFSPDALLMPEGGIFFLLLVFFLFFFSSLFQRVPSFALPLCFAPASAHCRRRALQRANISQRRNFYMFAAPVTISGDLYFSAASPGTPLDHLPLGARGTCIPGSHGTVTV